MTHGQFEPLIGFIICLENIIHQTEIDIRILNLNKNEIKQITDFKEKYFS